MTATTGLHDWFQTAPGAYLLEWERAQFDLALADVFGYHALQLGLPIFDTLAGNRMPHRWLAMAAPPMPTAQELAALKASAVDADGTAGTAWAASTESATPSAERTSSAAPTMPPGARQPVLLTDSTALPFAEASLDLVVLPHTLELSADPHATLREVQRVLVPEGKVAIAGLNPASLWGLRQWRARLHRGDGAEHLYLPDVGEFIGHWRLRDWLRLLQFELESVSFGCYCPAVRSARGLARFGWMDTLGARWWPVFGAAYVMMAVKRTPGVHLLGASWKAAPATSTAPVPIAGRAAPRPATQKNEP